MLEVRVRLYKFVDLDVLLLDFRLKALYSGLESENLGVFLNLLSVTLNLVL